MAKIITQRIYDSTAGWCVYETPEVIDAAPSSGDTTPNHTSNLVAGTHEVLGIRDDIRIKEWVVTGTTAADEAPTELWSLGNTSFELLMFEAQVHAYYTGVGTDGSAFFQLGAQTDAAAEATFLVTTGEIGTVTAGTVTGWTAQFVAGASGYPVTLEVDSGSTDTVTWNALIKVIYP